MQQEAHISTMRRVAGLIAAILGLQALWLLAAETVRPDLPYFPTSAAIATTVAENRPRADLAATIGAFRGTLWTESAMTNTARAGFAGAPADGPQGEAAASAAAAWAPSDPRAWLLLAATAGSEEAAAAVGWLKLSYYTGSNIPDLMPMRLGLVTRSAALTDPEVQELARGEIRTIMDRLPALRGAVVEAYRGARPDGQRLIEAAVRDVNAAFLNELSAPRPHR